MNIESKIYLMTNLAFGSFAVVRVCVRRYAVDKARLYEICTIFYLDWFAVIDYECQRFV